MKPATVFWRSAWKADCTRPNEATANVEKISSRKFTALACFKEDFEARIAHLCMSANRRRAIQTINLLDAAEDLKPVAIL